MLALKYTIDHTVYQILKKKMHTFVLDIIVQIEESDKWAEQYNVEIIPNACNEQKFPLLYQNILHKCIRNICFLTFEEIFYQNWSEIFGKK